MKVVGISGSSRMNGNTTIIIKTIFEELNKSCHILVHLLIWGSGRSLLTLQSSRGVLTPK